LPDAEGKFRTAPYPILCHRASPRRLGCRLIKEVGRKGRKTLFMPRRP